MEIAVKATYAHLVKDESLVQNSDKLYIVEFHFDQSWDGYAKSAVFEAGGVQQPPVALTDDRCIIPAECLKRAGINLKIGVSGIKDGVQKDTVWCLASKIMYALDPTQLMPPTHIDGDVKAQILEVIRENTATDAEVQEVLDNAFQSSWIPPENPEAPDNTATNEEVEDILDDVFGEEPSTNIFKEDIFMSKHTTLEQLKLLAQRTKGEISKVESKSLVGVKVNGVALAIADKMVDILIASGTANGTLAVNGKDVAVTGLAALAYKAQISEADLDTALKAVLDGKASGADLATLIGTDAGKSARTIANEELAAQLIPEGAQEALNTLTEIAQWIQDHPNDASAMNAAITKLNGIVASIGGDEDEYATVMAAIEGKITAALKDIASGATKVEKSEVNGNIKINGRETVVYTHPAAEAVEAGFKKVGKDNQGHAVIGDDVTKEDIVALGIPAQDTTYQPATSQANGLMSKEDKAKLDGIEVAADEEVNQMLDEVFGAAVGV